MAITYNTNLNSDLVLNSLPNNNALTKVLAVDSNNNVVWRDSSTITATANQSLNTTDNVQFNQVTTNSVLASNPSTSGLIFLSSNILFYQLLFNTTSTATQTVYTYNTVSGKNYLIYCQFVMKNTTLPGGATFIRSMRVTNIAGTTITGTIETYTSKSTGIVTGVNAQIVLSGTSVLMQVTGDSNTDNWNLYFYVIASL